MNSLRFEIFNQKSISLLQLIKQQENSIYLENTTTTTTTKKILIIFVIFQIFSAFFLSSDDILSKFNRAIFHLIYISIDICYNNTKFVN